MKKAAAGYIEARGGGIAARLALDARDGWDRAVRLESGGDSPSALGTLIGDERDPPAGGQTTVARGDVVTTHSSNTTDGPCRSVTFESLCHPR